jgi:pimeloyl-ACP methyl ester carboxylesterase
MRVQAAGILERLVRDGIPELLPGPDGALRPPIPLGRRVVLRGRGTTFVREIAAPADSPTLVLLHGWSASGGLNWFRVFETLGAEFRVLAPDLRGHARGLRSRDAFRLSDCADDVAAMLGELRTGPVLVAGYSMGGPVALLLARHHPELVAGLVLCAAAPRFPLGVAGARPIGAALGAVATGARVGGHLARVPTAPLRAVRSRRSAPAHSFVEWTIAEFRRHDARQLLEAAHAASTFDANPWLPEIDAPTAVVVTTRDRVVAPTLQLDAAARIEGASVHEIDGGHTACTRERFVGPFRAACSEVAARASRRAAARRDQAKAADSTSSASDGAIASAISHASSTTSGQTTMPMSIEST